MPSSFRCGLGKKVLLQGNNLYPLEYTKYRRPRKVIIDKALTHLRKYVAHMTISVQRSDKVKGKGSVFEVELFIIFVCLLKQFAAAFNT